MLRCLYLPLHIVLHIQYYTADAKESGEILFPKDNYF